MSYAEDLRHPKWQKRRLEVLSSAGWMCSSCKADDRQLHVHHLRYVKGRRVWEYDDSDLESLCEDCHRVIHDVLGHYKALMNDERTSFIKAILGQSARLERRGPFAFADHPKNPGESLIIHVPSGAWRSLRITLEQVIVKFELEPHRRRELLDYVLDAEGVSKT